MQQQPSPQYVQQDPQYVQQQPSPQPIPMYMNQGSQSSPQQGYPPQYQQQYVQQQPYPPQSAPIYAPQPGQAQVQADPHADADRPQPEEAMVVTAVVTPDENAGNWRVGFLDCCGAKGKFLCALFFPPFVWAVNVANVYRTPDDRKNDFCGILDHTRKLAFCLCYSFAPCISGPVMRHTLRKKYAIEGNVLFDIGAHCPCTYCCSLTQETREINSREDTGNFKTEVCDCIVCLALLATWFL